jgi:hypothetical protein
MQCGIVTFASKPPAVICNLSLLARLEEMCVTHGEDTKRGFCKTVWQKQYNQPVVVNLSGSDTETDSNHE